MAEFQAALEQLEAFDVNTKKLGLQTLANQGENAVEYASEIAKLLDDEEAEVRRATCVALGKIGSKVGRQVNNLVYALKDEDCHVRAEAARAIGAFGRQVALAHADKVAALAKDKEEDPQMGAVECLAAIGEATRLGAFLSSSWPAVCRVALVEIGRSPEARTKHAQLLCSRLSHQDVGVRLAAVQASGELGPGCTEEHLGALAGLREAERQVKVRRGAVQALGRVGPAGLRHLVSFFRDSDEGIRHFAAETLGGDGGERAAELSTELLGDPSAEVRRAALLALGKCKEHGRERAAEISRHLHDEDYQSRLAAIQALSELAASAEAEELADLSGDPQSGIRMAAVHALAKMGEVGAQKALSFLRDMDQAVRQAAVKVFSPLHSKMPAEVARQHAPAVLACLGDEDWRVRFAAVVALGDLKVSEYAEKVAFLHCDDNNQVRRSAVSALVKMGAKSVYAAAFLADKDKGVREEAQRGYDTLGGAAAADEDGADLSEVE